MRDKISHWLNGDSPLGIPSALQSKLSEELQESKFVNAVSVIVHRLSNIPWYTQKEILEAPWLAYDEFGYRLGYGGGYYDKTFERFTKLNHSFISVAVAFDDQKIDKIIKNKYDKKIDYVLTEKKIYN